MTNHLFSDYEGNKMDISPSQTRKMDAEHKPLECLYKNDMMRGSEEIVAEFQAAWRIEIDSIVIVLCLLSIYMSTIWCLSRVFVYLRRDNANDEPLFLTLGGWKIECLAIST